MLIFLSNGIIPGVESDSNTDFNRVNAASYLVAAENKKDIVINKEKDDKSYADAREKANKQADDSYFINILFLGIDRTAERDESLGIYRADTICVARLNQDNGEVRILCIPRDTYAFIPDKKKNDKINHSYAYGSVKNKGIEYTINSVNNFIRYSDIDYYFALDMEPIAEIVDYIGGVNINVDIDMKTHGADISKGLQVLDGKKAFDYIHWRYSGNGDIDRIKRQQKFVRAVFDQLKSSGNFVDCVKLVCKYSDCIRTDLTLKQILSLAAMANEISFDNIKYNMIPGNGKYIDNISYWIPDENKSDKMLKEFFSQ